MKEILSPENSVPCIQDLKSPLARVQYFTPNARNVSVVEVPVSLEDNARGVQLFCSKAHIWAHQHGITTKIYGAKLCMEYVTRDLPARGSVVQVKRDDQVF